MPAPTSTTWDPALYLDFDDHRARPFRDLVARVGAERPRHVVDLGCGPGHLTASLAARWPGARTSALDSSREMVTAARERGIDAVLAPVEDWVPAPDTDVVVTNAVLHWAPTHRELLPRWVSAMPAGSWFAMQVPGNHTAPSHVLAADLARHHGLDLGGAEAVDDPGDYADLLGATGAEVDAWETTYLHRLTGDDPVLGWISSTTLRPVRAALDDADYDAYVAALAPRLREAYPRRPDGSTWFPFRRVFAVAHVTD